MVLLLAVFRSVVIAIKAAAMNLLSVCAAYGVLPAERSEDRLAPESAEVH